MLLSIYYDQPASMYGIGICDHKILLTKNRKNGPNLSKLEIFMIYFIKYISNTNNTFHVPSLAEKSFSPGLPSIFF